MFNIRKKNKKGNVSFALKAVLTILILLSLVLIYKKYVIDGATQLVNCNEQGGTCQDKCKFDQFVLLEGKAAGCTSKSEPFCCVKMTTQDTECSNKAPGEPCFDDTSGMVCSRNKQCISRCDYCATQAVINGNFDEVCDSALNTGVKLFGKDGDGRTWSCNIASKCISNTMIKDSTRISSNYYCAYENEFCCVKDTSTQTR